MKKDTFISGLHTFLQRNVNSPDDLMTILNKFFNYYAVVVVNYFDVIDIAADHNILLTCGEANAILKELNLHTQEHKSLTDKEILDAIKAYIVKKEPTQVNDSQLNIPSILVYTLKDDRTMDKAVILRMTLPWEDHDPNQNLILPSGVYRIWNIAHDITLSLLHNHDSGLYTGEELDNEYIYTGNYEQVVAEYRRVLKLKP